MAKIHEAKTYHQNEYTPTHKEKYVGKKKPFYRSSWEYECFKWFDLNQNVLKWASEPLAIEYLYEVDGKFHKYWPDFYAEIKDVNGTVTKYILEVKPKKKLSLPKKPKKKSAKAEERYLNQVKEYLMIKNKKDAAEKFCSRQGFVFLFLTEEQIK